MATIDSLPKETHPMTQLSVAMLALQKDSKTFHDGVVPAYDSKLDWAANFAQMLGVNQDEGFKEAVRLYLMLHADHEGGNVSAHATHLVGSALSDPYYAWAAGLCGLAGPLHGLANQEGKVIPGFGHAVLRCLALAYRAAVGRVDACYQAIPPVLLKQAASAPLPGKVKNPYPNVDAHSGQLMYFYNLREQNFYTVVFAVSRTMGVMAQYIWSRAVNLPIERPKSLPLDELLVLAKKHRWERPKGSVSDQQHLGPRCTTVGDGLVINYADPSLAAGTAVLGLGLVVLPLLSKLNKLQSDEMFQHLSCTAWYRLVPWPAAWIRLMTRPRGLVLCLWPGDGAGCRARRGQQPVGRIQKWRDSVNANLRSLQKRSALAFLGLPPDSSLGAEAKKQKEKEEEEEKNRNPPGTVHWYPPAPPDTRAMSGLPPNERVKKLRMDVHDNTVRLWEKAKKSRDEIIGEKALKANAQPALNILRLFVERFVANEIKTLRHWGYKGCLAGWVGWTLSTLAMHFNYRLVARSGSPESWIPGEIQSKCAALLEAVGEVPQTVEQFLQRLEADLADQKAQRDTRIRRDRDKRRKEQRAAAQKAREAKGDFSGDAGAPAAPKAAPKAEAPKDGKGRGSPWMAQPVQPVVLRPRLPAEALAKDEEEKSTIQAAVKQKRTVVFRWNFWRNAAVAVEG
eukprot:Skav227963  [mRNA]  locus=scaffold146:751217:774291:- [translate_table: standard]